MSIRVVGCCGQAREAQRARQTARSVAGVTGSEPPVPSTIRTDVRLEQVGRRALRVRGPITGRSYLFTPAEPVHAVSSADAPTLLRSGLFRETSRA